VRMAAAKRFIIRCISNGQVKEFITIIDAEDAHLLRAYQWCTVTKHSGDAAKPYHYVVRHGVNGQEALHHVVLGVDLKRPERVYHINGNTLDNRKANLMRESCRITEVAA